jgi:hypothetical protein
LLAVAVEVLTLGVAAVLVDTAQVFFPNLQEEEQMQKDLVLKLMFLTI